LRAIPLQWEATHGLQNTKDKKGGDVAVLVGNDTAKKVSTIDNVENENMEII